MSFVRGQVHNQPGKFVEVERGATNGATIGTNLFRADGTLVSESDIALTSTTVQQIITASGSGSGGGGSGIGGGCRSYFDRAGARTVRG